MNASTVITETTLRLVWLRVFCDQAGRVASCAFDTLFQICLNSSRLRVPVSPVKLLVSSQTVLNAVGRR